MQSAGEIVSQRFSRTILKFHPSDVYVETEKTPREKGALLGTRFTLCASGLIYAAVVVPALALKLNQPPQSATQLVLRILLLFVAAPLLIVVIPTLIGHAMGSIWGCAAGWIHRWRYIKLLACGLLCYILGALLVGVEYVIVYSLIEREFESVDSLAEGVLTVAAVGLALLSPILLPVIAVLPHRLERWTRPEQSTRTEI